MNNRRKLIIAPGAGAGTHLAAEINAAGRLLWTMRIDLTLERLRYAAARCAWDWGKRG